MASLNKTQGQNLLAWTVIPTGSQNVGAAQALPTQLAATIFIHLGRQSSTAFTTGWPNVRVEASSASSGSGNWFPVAQYRMAAGSSVGQTTLNGAVIAGASSIVVTSATNLAVGDILFLGDTSTGNYELVRILSISGTTVTLEETLVNNHANGALVVSQSEAYVAQIDLTAIGRLRVVVDNAGGGVSVACEVWMVTGDSFSG